ncbi:MAG: serine protease [bacterium]|nr:serine protease [bacterium]
MPATSWPKTLLVVVLALALSAAWAPSGASAQGLHPALQSIVERDGLISAQEALLNAYRCRFDIDTVAVPGGCANGGSAVAAEPQAPFSGTPTWTEVARRDRLILAQEALLNAYRCRFGIDAGMVPGGCTDERPSSLPVDPASCDFAEHAGNAVESVWQVQTDQSLGTAFHLGTAADRSWWLTAEHVVRGSPTVQITHSGRTISARVVTADRIGDIAVLSTETGPDAAFEFGGLSGAAPGSAIFSVGYPLYRASTPAVSRGVVSRLLDDPELGQVLQTDASANPGNSGGPMLNACGKVAGMVVSKPAAQGTEGINYSITEHALREALAGAQADPDQEPAPPPPPKPVFGEGAPGRGEWQQGKYDNGSDYLWYVAHRDENGQGAVINEFPCGADFWSLAVWTDAWSGASISMRGYIRIWNEGTPEQATLYRADNVQHFVDGTARFVLHQEFSDRVADSPSAPYRIYIELLNVWQERGALISVERSAVADKVLNDARNRTRRQVSC